MWHYHDGMGWWMVFGSVWIVIFWIIILFLVFWVIKKISRNRDSGSDAIEKSDALSIARERYARGEISREEFEQIKKDLS